MKNKKTKFLFYISCFILLSLTGIFLGLHFQPQPVYAATNEINNETSENEEVQNNETSTVDVFANYTRTSLKEEYNNIRALYDLRNKKEINTEDYDRAVEVLKGNVKFIPKREFSTKFENDNKIDQVGDISAYAQSSLCCMWETSEIILTGIYGMPGDTFNIYVEAEGEDDKMPYIMYSQNHGYFNHWYEKVKLKKGLNVLKYEAFGGNFIAEDEIRGGAIYLNNPYLPEEQGEVNIYIEGGGYYPIFKKGGNEKEFLNFLKEYEEERKSKQLLDMAELVTDHAIITTTSSSLYEVYFNNDVITPSENLNLWGNYFTTIFEFNGIPTSEKSNLDIPYDPRNDYVKINFRYMTLYPGSGAYSFTYHIGWYYEHYWFANFYNAKNPMTYHQLDEHLIFGIGHELGHALDSSPRKINETTNDVSAAMAYFNIVGKPHLEQYQPFEKTVKALSNDYTLDYTAYDDGQIMYTKEDYPNDYDHNYLIWWDLESVFPGFWARFNNYFRKPLKEGLSTTELYVYYSSLATGVNLSNYYERWGFYYGRNSNVDARFIYDNASKEFKDAMQEATDNNQISKQYDHFWYVDANQYNFMLENENVAQAEREYKNGKPTITKILESNNERTIFINNNKSENHLGYEIFSKIDNESWKVVGFTYSSSFVDNNNYTSTPTYKVVAVNRFFKTSDESEPESKITVESSYVCKVNDVLYDNLSTAISEAEDNGTVYLLNDCSIGGKYVVKNITLQIDDSVNNDIYIYNSSTSFMFMAQLNFSIIGKDNAKIVFDGSNSNSINPVIYGASNSGNDKILIKNAIFRNFNTKFLAGVIYSTNSNLEICYTSFENCNSAKNDAAIYCWKNVKIDNCKFSNNMLDVYLKNLGSLTLANQTDNLSLSFDKFEDEQTIKIEGDANEFVGQIEIKIDGYTAVVDGNQIVVKPLSFKLKFNYNDDSFDYTIKDSTFIFGNEGLNYSLQENQYVEYEDCASGEKFKQGDVIDLDKDAEFNVNIKNKLSLKIFYGSDQSLNYYAYGEEVCLPTVDLNQNKVFAYEYGNKIYYAGEVYTLKSDSTLVAVYVGNLFYRFIVRDEIISVGYASYYQEIDLLDLEQEGFLGWQCGDKVVSNKYTLEDNTDFVAVFSGESKIYDLTQCEIQMDRTYYYYTGKGVVPKLTVYFNEFIVPSNCYSVSYSNNILPTKQAQVTISFVEGLSTGNQTQVFTILPKQVVQSEIEVSGLKDLIYNGSQTEQNLTISYKNNEISTFLMDYIGDRTNVGDVQIKITFYDNYSGTIYLGYTISEAEKPTVDTTIKINKKVKTLSDVKLPDGFVWEDETIEITSNRFTAKAIYKGEDVGNYLTNEVYFEIIIEPENTPKSSNGFIWMIVVACISIPVVACCVILAVIKHKRHKK